MSEPTLQQEIEARRPATEGTLQQIASVYVDSVAIIASAQAMMESVEQIFADNVTESGDLRVQLSGTFVEEVVIANAIAVTSSNLFYLPYDTRGFRDFDFVFFHTLQGDGGNPVELRVGFSDIRLGESSPRAKILISETNNPIIYNGFQSDRAYHVVPYDRVVELSSLPLRNYHLPHSKPWANYYGDKYRLALVVNATPMSGALSIWLKGVK